MKISGESKKIIDITREQSYVYKWLYEQTTKGNSAIPALQYIHKEGENVISVDGYNLAFAPDDSVEMPGKNIRFNGTPKIGENIVTIAKDAKFPDAKKVIPEGDAITKIYVSKTRLMQMLRHFPTSPSGGICIEYRGDRIPLVIKDETKRYTGIVMPMVNWDNE